MVDLVILRGDGRGAVCCVCKDGIWILSRSISTNLEGSLGDMQYKMDSGSDQNTCNGYKGIHILKPGETGGEKE